MDSSLNNQNRIQLLRQIDSPKQEDQENADLHLQNNNQENNNDKDKEQLISENNNNYNDNNLADFKIEPIKGKETLMLTALNRNKLIEDNFLREQNNFEKNPLSISRNEIINKHEEIDCNEQKHAREPEEKEDLYTKQNDLSKLNVKDENNNPNTSVLNSSKLRLKSVFQNVCDAVNSSRCSDNMDSEKKNNMKLSVNFNLGGDLNSKMIFNENLKKEINDIGKPAAAEKANSEDKNVSEKNDYLKENIEVKQYDSDDTLKNDNEKEKLDENKQAENNKPEKASKIKFNEEKNEVVIHENKEAIESNNQKNDANISVICERKETKENKDKVDLNLSKASIKSKHPSPKKKRSSCQKVIKLFH